MKTTKEMIKVMQHYTNGGEVECISYTPIPIGTKQSWYLATCPCWDWSRYDYRIKKEPAKVYHILRASGCLASNSAFLDRKNADSLVNHWNKNPKTYTNGPYRVVKMVEMDEETT